jgi:CubicO group peptidase (beta-lactamase class C family)
MLSRLLTILGLLLAGPAAAQASLPAEAGAWTDAYFQRTIAKTHAPGVVVVVVDHGKVVFSRGYGTTAVHGGRPVDPATTPFRLGSISKVFTALAASEMIEEGRIDPKADVNAYLRRIKAPKGFDRPVTVADLLLHEGGFAADLRGMDAATDAGAQVSDKELQRLLPPRVRPAGRYPAYDNNGWGVLGLTLADASGQSYRQLIDQRLFLPLGMTHSVVGVPDARRDDVAHDHTVFADGSAKTIDWSLLKPIEQGAGDVSASGADMARFMTALLQGGQIDGRQVIPPAVYAAMTDFDAHRLNPALPGYGRALYEFWPDGRRAIRHDGGMKGSAASMVLYPEAQVGVFFAINARPENPFEDETLSGTVRGIRLVLGAGNAKVSLQDFLGFLDFHDAFAARYIAAAEPKIVLPAGPLWGPEVLATLPGRYISTSSGSAGFAGALQTEVIEGRPVVLGPDGALIISGMRHTQVAPGLFRNDKTGKTLGFERSKDGVFLGDSWLWRQIRVPGWRNPLITVAPLVLLPLVMLLGLCLTGRSGGRRRRVGAAAAGLGALYLAGWLIEAQFAAPVLVAGLSALSLLWRAVFSAVVVGLAVWPLWLAWAWRASPPTRGFRGWAARFLMLVLAASAWALVALAGVWHLLNPFR